MGGVRLGSEGRTDAIHSQNDPRTAKDLPRERVRAHTRMPKGGARTDVFADSIFVTPEGEDGEEARGGGLRALDVKQVVAIRYHRRHRKVRTNVLAPASRLRARRYVG